MADKEITDDLTPDEVDEAIWDLDCSVPLPLWEMAEAGTPNALDEVIRQVVVLTAELLDLKEKVATLEAARS